MRLKVRSLVGLLPLCASSVFESDILKRHPKLLEMINIFKQRHPDIISHETSRLENQIEKLQVALKAAESAKHEAELKAVRAETRCEEI